MPITPHILNFPKYRARHLYLKYFDCLKTHLVHFERNLIGFGYSFDYDILSHQISIGDIIAKEKCELVQLPLSPKIGRVRFFGGGWL